MMMNPLGKIQNNHGITEFARELKKSDRQYKLLSKEEERELVDSHVSAMKFLDGSDVLDKSDPLYVKWATETDAEKRKNLYYRVRRVLVWKSEAKKKEFYDLLVMHNIRFVFNLSKKYCKGTRDFDNMVEKGLYGLVKAANKFNPFMPMMKKDPDASPEDKKNKTDRIVEFDGNGNVVYGKFCTYAKNWIFKYIVQEFQDKSVKIIDNHTISLDDFMRSRGGNTDSKTTVENFIESKISPEFDRSKSVESSISENETSEIYENLRKYISETNELTATEKMIMMDTYYNGMNTSEIAEKINENASFVNQNRNRALRKMRTHMMRDCNINSSLDVLA